MAKLGFLKRLVKEDFKKEDQDIISKIAFILNPALESITNSLNNSLTFAENMNAQVKDLTVEVKSGKPVQDVSFRSTLKGLCRGIICIRASNLSNTNSFPTSSPFLSFTEDMGQITITHISGLQDNEKYSLRIVATV